MFYDLNVIILTLSAQKSKIYKSTNNVDPDDS